MKITYHEKTDLLYISLEDSPDQVVNKRVDADVVLELAEDNRIVGIEILDASKRIRLGKASTFGVSGNGVGNCEPAAIGPHRPKRQPPRCSLHARLRGTSCYHNAIIKPAEPHGTGIGAKFAP
jgi:uncharacterized protein YuzE